MTSAFELLARERKAAKLVSRIPLCRSRAEQDSLVALLERSSQQWRDSLALAAGVRSPSGATWAVVVAGVRARPVVTESEIAGFDRDGRLTRQGKGQGVVDLCFGGRR